MLGNLRQSQKRQVPKKLSGKNQHDQSRSLGRRLWLSATLSRAGHITTSSHPLAPTIQLLTAVVVGAGWVGYSLALSLLLTVVCMVAGIVVVVIIFGSGSVIVIEEVE
jgi:hypothetical protein